MFSSLCYGGASSSKCEPGNFIGFKLVEPPFDGSVGNAFLDGGYQIRNPLF